MRPYDFDEVYSTIVLGTTVSPGTVMLRGHERAKAWEVKQAKGNTGASTTLQGDPIPQFDATFYLASDQPEIDEDQFFRWDAFQRLIESTTSGAKPTALPIYHPDLARVGITEVVNGGVGGFVHDGKGGVSVTVKFLVYRPPKPRKPKKAKSKPAAKPAGSGTRAKPDPNAAAKRQLAALLEVAKRP